MDKQKDSLPEIYEGSVPDTGVMCEHCNKELTSCWVPLGGMVAMGAICTDCQDYKIISEDGKTISDRH